MADTKDAAAGRNVVVRLFASRKFVATLITLLTLVGALVTKHIDGTTFASAATPLVMLLVAAWAAEDYAAKSGAKPDAAPAPAPTDADPLPLVSDKSEPATDKKEGDQ